MTDRIIRLWDVSQGSLLAELKGHTDRVYAVAYGPDDTWLASASWDGQAVLWRNGVATHRLRAHSGRLWAAVASPGTRCWPPRAMTG